MKCLSCKSKTAELVGVLNIEVRPRLQKGGDIDPSSVGRLTHSTLSELWAAQAKTEEDGTKFWEVVCNECGTLHHYAEGRGQFIPKPLSQSDMPPVGKDAVISPKATNGGGAPPTPKAGGKIAKPAEKPAAVPPPPVTPTAAPKKLLLKR